MRVSNAMKRDFASVCRVGSSQFNNNYSLAYTLCNASSLAVLLINYRAKPEKPLVHGLNRRLIALNGKISLMLQLINVQIYKSNIQTVRNVFFFLYETIIDVT